MAPYRDVQAFHERAPGYESGRRGEMHRRIVERTAQIALATQPAAASVLDVGCGTGLLLRRMAAFLPHARDFTGIDPAAGMIAAATASVGDDPRLRFLSATAEHLPFSAGAFDLVISTTAFDHWVDQRAGLVECARVLRGGGHLVLADLFSWWLLPTVLYGSRRGRARTVQAASSLLREVGFHSLAWRDAYGVIIRAVVASR